MLPSTNKRQASIVLGDDDCAPVKCSPASMVQGNDYKLDLEREKLKENILKYFAKFPTVKNGLLTSDYIKKVCCVVEKHCYKKGMDKRTLVLEIMSSIADRKFSRDEEQLIISSIQFIHKSGLIKVSLMAKVWYRFLTFFQ